MPEVIFPGPEGRLEGRYHPQKDRDAPIAIVLHPHPQFGGSMNQRVVHKLHYTFYNMGFTVLRFNFRGVGRSQGEYDQGIGELSDAASALDYLQSMNTGSKHCWVAGFSFGAWIGMQLLMRRPEITGFISVAPPANMYDFSFLAPCPSSGLIINGSADRVAPPADTVSLVNKLHDQKGITITHEVVEGAGHFFDDEHLETMSDSVKGYVRRRLTENTR
ncbi:alpha/beta hydrolase [Marivivens donghaensis]|uniref:Alpha/beta hydrolase n=1 Tax=Marivivens donghaensis TaxID=1699413 RepID=A0ABX0VXK1_9RHOB|nr:MULTISPECIES: alpha/beta hydrolase [Marivivens]NIY72833.1 alpha/beta hydrolase [Marivivens donghaensis]